MTAAITDMNTLAASLSALQDRLEDAMATNKYPDLDALLGQIILGVKSASVDGGLIDELEVQLSQLDEHDHPRAVGIIRGAMDLLAQAGL